MARYDMHQLLKKKCPHERGSLAWKDWMRTATTLVVNTQMWKYMRSGGREGVPDVWQFAIFFEGSTNSMKCKVVFHMPGESIREALEAGTARVFNAVDMLAEAAKEEISGVI